MKHSLTPILAALLLSSCGINSNKQASNTIPYTNPVIDFNCPDPSMLDNRERDGWIYLASTTSKGNVLPVYRSKDMLKWEFVCDGFAGKKPSWSKGGLWAPDLNYVDGKYILYYAMGVWGNLEASASGVAVADNPYGPYEDKGMIVSYANTGVLNSIDPNYLEDGGKKYLYWGSLGSDDRTGIHVIELSEDGLSIKEGATPTRVSTGRSEAAYAFKHGRYYYLMASSGSCCEGVKSTYHLVVGRAGNPLGPFKDQDGWELTDPSSDHAIMANASTQFFAGAGHNAEILTDDNGQAWMAMHSYWEGNGYKGRCLVLEPLCWEKGWPRFTTGAVQTQVAFSPAFK